LQKSWNRYGGKAFRFEIIALCDRGELCELEQFYIDSYQTADGLHGYNMRPLANSNKGVKRNAETRARMSVAAKKRWENPSTREKLVAAFRKTRSIIGWQTSESPKVKRRVGRPRNDELPAELRKAKGSGSRPSNTKLTEEGVRDIRERLARGESQAAIARLYGVTRQAIFHIKMGANWVGLSEE
jgi:hypothetical protein